MDRYPENPLPQKADFEAMADALVKTGSDGSFGKVHVITLVGDSGPDEQGRQIEKAQMIIEGILNSRLSKTDSYFKIQPGKYLLLFPDLNEAEGRLRALALATTIRRRLFGECGKGLDIATHVESIARLRTQTVESLIEAMDEVLSQENVRRGIVMEALFQPIWQARDERIVGSRVRLRRRFGIQQLFGPNVLFGGSDDPLALDANLVLRQKMDRIHDVKSTLFLPQFINPSTLGDLRSLGPWIRQLVERHSGILVVELVGNIAFLSRPQMREIVRAILRGGAAVGVQSLPDADGARFLYDCGVRYLCISVDRFRFSGVGSNLLVSILDAFTREIAAFGFIPCLWGAQSSVEIKKSIPLGFQMFSGTPVGTDQEKLVHPAPRPARQIFM